MTNRVDPDQLASLDLDLPLFSEEYISVLHCFQNIFMVYGISKVRVKLSSL